MFLNKINGREKQIETIRHFIYKIKRCLINLDGINHQTLATDVKRCFYMKLTQLTGLPYEIKITPPFIAFS